MADPAKRRATYEDVLSAPEHLVAEIIEVVSPSTGAKDRARKLPIYAREGVRHVWLVDPLQRTLDVLRLQDRNWVIVAVHEGGAKVRAEPFDAIELDLGILWADVDLGTGPAR